MPAFLKFNTKVIAAFAVAVLVSAILAATTWNVTRDAIEAGLRVAHTHEVIDSLAQTRANTLLIELNTQSYRLSGDPARVAERDLAIAARNIALRRIKDLTVDNASQQERWARLRLAVDERIAIAKRTVQLRDTEGTEAVNAYVASAPLRETRERLFQTVREMEDEERRLLAERSGEQARVRDIAVATGALATLALVALLLATFFLIRGQFQATEASRRALEATNARVAAILDTVADGIITINTRGIVETVNPAALRIFGYAAAEVIGNNIKMLMPEPYQGEHDGYIERYLATGAGRIIGRVREVAGRRKDGSTFPMDLAVNEMQLGEERRFTGVVRDTTERKRAEDAIVAAREEADAANRAKSTFLATMSHEIRTPLNAILGFSRLMRNAPEVSAEQARNLDIIFRSGEHLLNLINNVLNIAKIESGRVPLEERDFDLHHLLHEIQSLTHVRAAEKNLSFSLMLSPDLPRHVSADAGKLGQVLINLVANATKFTRDGRVLLKASVAASEQGRRARLRFAVEDTGPGIRAEDRMRLFSPFVQLGDQPSGETGTGLGLAISKQYVELMGGSIGVDSEPGKGSVFYFEIPVGKGSASAEDSIARPLHARVDGLAPGQEPSRLLIVEDQPENRLLLHALLDPLGFDLREAVNGREAVAVAEQWQPHLIWMDIRMPDMDGLEATRQIRAGVAGAQIKIVAVSAHALEDERLEIMAAGCDDFIRKPYRDSEIFAALEKNLGVRFVYADEQLPAAAVTAAALSAGLLAQVPAPMLEELRQFAVLLDGPRCLELAQEIDSIDADLGARLRHMIDNLQYQELLEVLEESVGVRSA